ncbi:hypothetical protein GH714_025330 [Hevea brasiliensis]|uniref:Ultraviolet-B receptor UVR8 n=1 Tax=Hevea brasiliensis TaxID=3981 RepID=A0A6A6MPY4_HEVBR|nr:hypothetical protein GH714_025330 [Hevea brasiliensis]
MADRYRLVSIEELPSHLILEIMTAGRLSAIDLVCLELTSKTFGGSHGLYPHKFKSMVDYAAFQLCVSHGVYNGMAWNAQKELFDRCGGNWKRVLRFLQAVEESSGMVETSAGNMQITTGRYHTLLISNSSVYSCGSGLCGVLGHGPETTQCVAFTRISFPPLAHVVQVSASHNHAAFVLESGKIAAGPSYVLAVTDNGAVYSFGSGSNFCLGHGEQHNEFLPRVIQTFRRKGIHVVRVSAGDEHAVALDSSGFVYTWGKGYCGALGHGDEIDKTLPEPLNSLKSYVAVQVCARKRKTFVLVDSGHVYGFGWMGFGSLGFPDRGVSDKVMRPRILDSLRAYRVSQISTGLYHTVAVTSQGRIFGFGDNERAQLGHDTLRGCLEPTEIFVPELKADTCLASESE